MWRVRRTWRNILFLAFVAGSCDPGMSGSGGTGTFGPTPGGAPGLPAGTAGAFANLCFDNGNSNPIDFGGRQGAGGSSGASGGASAAASGRVGSGVAGDSVGTSGGGAGGSSGMADAGEAAGAMSGAAGADGGATATGGASMDTAGAAPFHTAGAAGASGGATSSTDPCPKALPIPLDQATCETPVTCDYPDGTVCDCIPCAVGLCWLCNVAQVPFGCPHIPPKSGEACAWIGVSCEYPVCDETTFTRSNAVCCDGSWRAFSVACAIGPN